MASVPEVSKTSCTTSNGLLRPMRPLLRCVEMAAPSLGAKRNLVGTAARYRSAATPRNRIVILWDTLREAAQLSSRMQQKISICCIVHYDLSKRVMLKRFMFI